MRIEDLHIDEDLFQDSVGFFIKTHNYPPLAAKIFTLLNFDLKGEGIDFETLVILSKASKSSVSSNLKTLLDDGCLLEINKLGERRRLFIVNPKSIEKRFEKILDVLHHEKRLMKKWKKWIVKNQVLEEDINYKFDSLQDHLTQSIINIEKTIKKISRQ